MHAWDITVGHDPTVVEDDSLTVSIAAPSIPGESPKKAGDNGIKEIDKVGWDMVVDQIIGTSGWILLWRITRTRSRLPMPRAWANNFPGTRIRLRAVGGQGFRLAEDEGPESYGSCDEKGEGLVDWLGGWDIDLGEFQGRLGVVSKGGEDGIPGDGWGEYGVRDSSFYCGCRLFHKCSRKN
ncbi:hypothetical protein Salat_2105200 [Sesamum alatum]|uniref:Uncharacterized protein n=1 Tax=Sesamum alatum TaxID=300844 RepID=A0AAE1Y1I5_9LAMI|nr:hypothetical protein Salat_2105200 [Sesamum alatum]